MFKLTHLIWFVALVLTACSGKKAEWRTMDGAVWGTTYHITYNSDCSLSDSVMKAMHVVDYELNVFNPASTVSRYNNALTDTIGAEMGRVIRVSQAVNVVSHGAFDPTVSPLVDLWGFGRNKEDAAVPDSTAIAECLKGVGIDRCTVRGNVLTHSLARRPQFNFSAIAKGYGVDLVAEALARSGCRDFMVEIGGEVRVSGNNPRGEAWHVQIDAPDVSGTHKRLEVVELSDKAMATSGNYRNFRILPDGTRVGHTLSPATGRPIATNLLSATVIAPDCMTADALATACMALPADSARAMIKRLPGVKAYLVTVHNNIIEVSGPNNAPTNGVQTKD